MLGNSPKEKMNNYRVKEKSIDRKDSEVDQLGTIGTIFIFAIGGVVLMICIIAGAFKVREYREETHYIKMEINRSDSLDEREYWERRLQKHYARVNPFYKLKKK